MAKRYAAACDEVLAGRQACLEQAYSGTMHPSEDPGHQVRDGIFIVQDERIVFVNHACAQMLLTAPAQLMGLRFTDLLTAGQARLWRDRLAPRAGARRRRSEGRMLLQTTEGAQIEVTATVTPTLFNNLPALLGTLHRTTPA